MGGRGLRPNTVLRRPVILSAQIGGQIDAHAAISPVQIGRSAVYAVLLAIGALAVLTGCTTHGLIRELDVPPERAAHLTVIRLSRAHAMAATWTIFVEEHAVLRIRNGEHATFAVPPGDRIIMSDCASAWLIQPNRPLRVSVEAGGHSYVTLGAGGPALSLK
jgi:hypothetical protein